MRGLSHPARGRRAIRRVLLPYAAASYGIILHAFAGLRHYTYNERGLRPLPQRNYARKDPCPMKTYNEAEVQTFLKHCHFDLSEEDGQGQIVIYTGLFRWEDGTIHDEPQGE